MGMVRQTSMKRMAYHVMQSVDLPEIPQKPTYKRVKASLCYLFEELEDDLMGVYMQGSTNYTALSYFARIAVSGVLLAELDNALGCTRAKKLALIMSMNCLDVSQQKSCRKKTCYVCKGNPFFESLTTCAGCMEYVCKKCRFNEHVLARDTRLGSHLKRAVFCSVCISKVDLPSLNQTRATAHEDEVAQQVNATQSATSSESEEESEDEDTRSSLRLLTTFVHRVSIQMQELNTGSDERASNMSSMGRRQWRRNATGISTLKRTMKTS